MFNSVLNVFCMFTRGYSSHPRVFGILVEEQANAAMWRSIEQCHVDVMGRFDRELGQSPGGRSKMVMSSFNICRNSDSSADSAIKHHHKSSKSGIQHDIQPLRSSRHGLWRCFFYALLRMVFPWKKKHGRAQPPEFSEVRGTSVLGGCRLLHQVSQTRAGQSAGGIVFFSRGKPWLFHHEDFCRGIYIQ